MLLKRKESLKKQGMSDEKIARHIDFRYEDIENENNYA